MKKRTTQSNIFSLFSGFLPFFLFLVFVNQGFSQNTCTENNNFTLSGNARHHNGGYIELTSASQSQSGQAWGAPVDLSKSFTIEFLAYFGNRNAGADGLAFVFRGLTSGDLGTPGLGIGYGNITPSVAVEFDTWKNDDDPFQDHIAIHSGGDPNNAGRLTNNVTMNNLEDGRWHTIKIRWNANNKKLRVKFNGTWKLTLQRDIVANDLNNNPNVYFGFTAATGWEYNQHAICVESINATYSSFNNNSALPIELTYFQAQNNNNQVDLSWSTATELDNEYFDIERSKDGKSWEVIDQVEGAGTTTEQQNYLAVDRNPLNGTSFYRLKQVDFSGDFEYSDIVSVNRKAQIEGTVNVYPNPAIEWIEVKLSETASFKEIFLTDATGRVIAQQKVSTTNTVNRFDLTGLDAGMYFIHANSEESSLTEKVIVKK